MFFRWKPSPVSAFRIVSTWVLTRFSTGLFVINSLNNVVTHVGNILFPADTVRWWTFSFRVWTEPALGTRIPFKGLCFIYDSLGILYVDVELQGIPSLKCPKSNIDQSTDT